MATADKHTASLNVESAPLLVDFTSAAALCGRHLAGVAGHGTKSIRIDRSLPKNYCEWVAETAAIHSCPACEDAVV